MSHPPSSEVSATALARAQQLATGLYPHQVEGVAFLLARRRSILADDMGLGKTRQSILALVEAEPAGPWLVVCPASVKRNWEREIRLALGDEASVVIVDRKTLVPDPDFRGWVIINYDILKRNLPPLRKLPWVGFIFDEAHYLKNYRSQRTKAACTLLAAFPQAVVHCLTGTPMMNRPRDLFPLLQLVYHPLGKNFLSFAKRYCDAQRGEYGWETKGASNLDELTVQLHGTMLRRTKDEVLDLPGKMRTWLSVDVPATGKRSMQRLLQTLLKDTVEGAVVDGERLPPLSRAKLLARLTPVRSSIAGAKMKHSIEFAKGIVAQGEKVVIYSCFREVIEAIAEEFAPSERRLLTGAMAADDRQQAVDEFQQDEDVRVFCATLIAGGVGITLTAARTVIFNDLDWVPANHWQAEDRAYRIGQTHPVNVYYFQAKDSIDEFVGQVLETKSHLIQTVVEGVGVEASAVDGDVFNELERLLQGLDPDVLESDVTTLTAALTAYRESPQVMAVVEADRSTQPRTTNPELIRSLARALSPTATSLRYRVSSSEQGEGYELEVDGTDVTCSCRGFSFRGQCKHARILKDALASNEPVPPEYEPQ